MEKEMNKKKISLIITLFGLIIIVCIATILKVIKVEKEKKYNYEIDRIISTFKTCIKEGKCEKENTSLEMLYSNMEIEEFINPYTDKPFDKNSYILISTYEFIDK